MMSMPIILVTPCSQDKGAEFGDASLSLSRCYTRALQASGALSCVMPLGATQEEIEKYVERCDGVMLTGGSDIEPGIYRKDMPVRIRKLVGETDVERDYAEMQVIECVFRLRKPLLAICRGHQLLNVAFGGTLIPDIATESPHALNHRRMDLPDEPVHDVAVAPDSLLAKVTGKTSFGVNSSHHQAVDRVAPPFRVAAASLDGIVEAMELQPGEAGLLPFLLAVQFHPERLFDRRPEFLRIFAGFMRACALGRMESL
jgi:putative glutamine amidotransferase